MRTLDGPRLAYVKMTQARRYDERGRTLLSEVVAEQIARQRKRAGLTHRDLAELCKTLGWPALTASAISNIETGRRDKEGRRRREVTVDELTVIARALEMPPVLLLAPLGEEDQIEVVPGQKVATFQAYEWLTGQATWTGGHGGEQMWISGPSQLITTYREYEQALQKYFAAQVEGDDAAEKTAWKQVTLTQQIMSEHGWRIPPLPGQDES